MELAGGGVLRFEEDFLLPADADRALAELLAAVPWTQGEITIAGKRHKEPRLTAWYGDPDARYTYTGRPLEPLPWTPLLLELRARVEAAAGARFNSVLLNFYRDGRDSMGLHADDERELGPDPVIASLSLGAPRRFVLRPRRDRGVDAEPVELDVGHGSLLVMAGATQRAWKHGVPKRAASVGARVNLTFRRIVPTA
jgi:alkylated DNA repair dioxygenase AlkB